jgi:glutathione S-transferase
MLKFYYNSRSPMARRVWHFLLEKDIPFEPILMNLNGDQMQPEYLQLNPFHHVPVIVDSDFRVIESLAILDYLEAKHPTPSLLPTDIQALGTVRMVQMVSTNELLPKVIALIFDSEDSKKYVQAKENLAVVLKYLDGILGDNDYFGGKQLSLADVVVGTDISLLPKIGFTLDEYPRLHNWFERLMQRKAWQQTELSMEDYQQFKRVLTILRQRKLRVKNVSGLRSRE